MGLKDLTPHLPPPCLEWQQLGSLGPQFPQVPPNQASSSHPALGVWSPHPVPDALAAHVLWWLQGWPPRMCAPGTCECALWAHRVFAGVMKVTVLRGVALD